MKLTIKNSRIRGNNFKISTRDYVLFTMFSAPFIDLLNGLIGGIVPVGVLVRTAMIGINLYLCSKWVTKSTCLLFFVFIYVMGHSVFTAMLVPSANIIENVSFGMKLILFLSEMQLLIRCSQKGIIGKNDFLRFWCFSCWVVPISIAICKALGLNNYANLSNAGLYSSVNAMSIILIIQFVISRYLTRFHKKYWLIVLLNVLAVTLLRTKSPYLYIAAVIIALIMFYSKHRIKILLSTLVAVVVAYYAFKHFFSSDYAAFIEYQTLHLSNALRNNKIWNYLFSGRNTMLATTWKEIVNNGLMLFSLLFGIGRSSFASGIEMDVFEILFAYGALVTVVVYYLVLRSFGWKGKDRTENLFLNIALICMISFGTLGGHTFLEAISATYSAILIGCKYSCKQ